MGFFEINIVADVRILAALYANRRHAWDMSGRVGRKRGRGMVVVD